MISHSRPFISHSDIARVAGQISSERLAAGHENQEFEKELLAWVGGEVATTTPSGSYAAILCLRAVGVGIGDEVIMPTYVCHEVRDAVLAVGAHPVFCDSAADSWNADRQAMLAKISTKTKAAIAVNIFGIQNDVSDIGVPIIEDHCQSFGISKIESEAAFFSFHATKCLTTGAGGAAVFKSKKLADAVRLYASPMSDISASLGRSQLADYEHMLRRRGRIAERYLMTIDGGATETLRPLKSMYFRFPLRIRQPFDAVQQEFAKRDVAVRRGVDALLHRSARLPDAAFPNACRLFEETVSIPIYPALDDLQAERVVRVTNAILQA